MTEQETLELQSSLIEHEDYEHWIRTLESMTKFPHEAGCEANPYDCDQCALIGLLNALKELKE